MGPAPTRFVRLRRSLRGAAGIARSLRIYYANPVHRRKMVALYGTMVAKGDLVFDIGSHVGDRIGAFRSLGARVIAAEPQPAAFRWLRLRYGRDRQVTLLQRAVGDAPGTVTFHVNTANPTVSTASLGFMDAARGAEGWEGQNWDETISVPAVTLDELIAQHGEPAFVKIDVEGFELHVLKGLSRALPKLSFEFTTIQRDVAFGCIDRLSALGAYRFNAALGESQKLEFADGVSAEEMRAFIRALPHSANSGDIYAHLAR
ncbi:MULTISPECIES: FkbM family methyltransferase [Rhodomicrobium]|uniref:FkbM family methyltransferase n=1 Tax=Rhodomicrobium TaxID=1068 RepID=UPI000B4B9943|nr:MULTISPECIES: FkbM family methyltransferase [Rhodomicrobium]